MKQERKSVIKLRKLKEIRRKNLEKNFTLSLELAMKVFPVSFGLLILSNIGDIFLYLLEIK